MTYKSKKNFANVRKRFSGSKAVKCWVGFFSSWTHVFVSVLGWRAVVVFVTVGMMGGWFGRKNWASRLDFIEQSWIHGELIIVNVDFIPVQYSGKRGILREVSWFWFCTRISGSSEGPGTHFLMFNWVTELTDGLCFVRKHFFVNDWQQTKKSAGCLPTFQRDPAICPTSLPCFTSSQKKRAKNENSFQAV